MKKIIIFSIAIFLVNIAKTQSVNDLVSTNFISLTVPQDYQGELSYLNSLDVIETKKAAEVKHDKTILPSFPNLVSSVTLYQVEKDGSLSLLGNSLSLKNSTYVVIYDYTQSQTIHIDDAENEMDYFALVGISVRMVARVSTKTSGLNLSNLYGLGIAANKKKVDGSLEVRANGINSLQINSLIPVTTDLSPSSIANALQSVATVKSHIYDPESKITPQFLAFSATGKNKSNVKFDFQNLSKKVKSFKFD